MYAPAAALQQSLNRRLQRQQMDQSAENADQNQALSLLTQGQAAQQGDQQRDAMLERVKEQSATAALRARLEAEARENAARMAGDARVKDAETRLLGVETQTAGRSGNVRDTNDARVLIAQLKADQDKINEELRAASRENAARNRPPPRGANPPVKATPEMLAIQSEIKNAEREAAGAENAARALVVAGNILPGQEQAHAGYMKQAQDARALARTKTAQLSSLPVPRAYTNMGAPPAADPSLTVKSADLQKAEALLRTAEQSGDPARIKFAQDLVAKARAGR